tara:strand:+ start:701 stop:2572 length:1872 start_codon:yes stop_codon:yes gene_type:complete
MRLPFRRIAKKYSALHTILRGILRLTWVEADGFVKKRLCLTLLFVFGMTAFAAFAPVIFKTLIDGLTTTPGDLATSSIFEQPYHTFAPALLLLAYLFSLWLSRSFAEIRWYVFGAADQRLQRRLSRRLFSHIMNLPFAFHLDRKSGALNQTLINGLSGFSIILQHAVFSLLPVLIELLIISAVLTTFYHSAFPLILSVSVLAYLLAFSLGVARIAGPSRAVATAQVEAYATLTDSLLNYETAKYFTAESRYLRRYDTALSLTERQWAHFNGRKMLNGLLIASIFALSLGGSLTLATRGVLSGTLTIGDFILINSYMLQIIRPLEILGFAFRDIAQGAAFAEKMMGLLAMRPEANPPRPRAPMPPGPVELSFRQVNFSYRSDRPLLREISFTIKPGNTVALVGPSGSGKSSLVRLLFRLYEPTRGDILWNKSSIAGFSLAELRQKIAVVPQETILLNDSISRNIAMGRSRATTADIIAAAKQAHIHHLITSLPQGYQTNVGERGLRLSGGEKQRISIARAVLKRPEVFIFDEATASLDSKTEKAILANLKDISRNATTLMIAHRLSTVVHADEILVLEKGLIVERGPHDDLLRQDGAYAALWRAQLRDFPDVVPTNSTADPTYP